MWYYDTYREWADVLNDWKCGDPEPVEEIVPDVKPGDIVEYWFCGKFEEAKRVSALDIEWIRKQRNDPENDANEFRKVTEEENKRRPKGLKTNRETMWAYYVAKIGKWI